MTPHLIITTDNLTRRFGETVAVDGLTLAIEAGEVFGILGHNGAGKTTTVRLLNGVLGVDAGSARVFGLDPTREGVAVRRRTGVLTETPALDEKLTAHENLHIYAQFYDVPAAEIAPRARQLLRDFELDERAAEPVGGYSKGMKQRLALARTLIHQPELIFLDEPTGGLDPVATRRVHDLIRRLSHDGQHTVVLCTHNLAEAQKLCSRVAVMEQGRAVALGTPAELARSLWKGVRLEIELEAATAASALDALQRHAQARQVTWDAPADEPTGRASLWVSEPAALPDLLAALVHAGGRVYRFAPQEPTLEDVYFALHEEVVP